MAFDPLSPEVVYAIKGNVKFPLTQALATAAETAATNRLNDALSPVTVTVTAGTIKVAS
jgi:hypothetical protein